MHTAARYDTVLGSLVGRWRLPMGAARRLARLPNRHVVVELTDNTLVFQTANERLEVSWDEFANLKRLKSFWLVCLRSGAKIPVPVDALPAEAIAILEARGRGNVV